MLTGSLSPVSNRADWTDTIELTDATTGELVDLTGATIVLAVRDRRGCLILEASTDNGRITFPITGQIHFEFPVSTVRGIAPGTYDIGLTMTRDDMTEQILIGSVAISNGVVP